MTYDPVLKCDRDSVGLPDARFWVGDASAVASMPQNWSPISGGPDASKIPDANDPVEFDELGDNNCTLDANNFWGDILMHEGYTSTLDWNDKTITMWSGGDAVFEASGGTVDCGASILRMLNGDFDNRLVGTWTRGTSEIQFSGTCVLYSSAVNLLGAITIQAGATVTTGDVYVACYRADCVVNGTFVIASGHVAHVGLNNLGTLQVGENGVVTGPGTVRMNPRSAGSGLTVFAPGGTIDVAVFQVRNPVAAATPLQTGIYESALVKISSDSADAMEMTFLGVSYLFQGALEFENTGAGVFTIANDTNNPTIILYGDLVWENSGGGTLTYTAGSGSLIFYSNQDQSIDFSGQTPEPFSVTKTAGELALESGTFVMGTNSTAYDFTVSGDADVDLGDSALTLTLASGGDFLADGSGTLDMGTAILTVNGGRFDNNAQTTWVPGGSTVVMQGVSEIVTHSSKDFTNLTIDTGAVTTSFTNIDVVDGELTVAGSLEIPTTKTMQGIGSDIKVLEGGDITGAGLLFLYRPATSTQGVTELVGDITIAAMTVYEPEAGGLCVVPGIYAPGTFKIGKASRASVLTLSATPDIGANPLPYTFAGILEFESTDANDLEIANDTNDPDLAIQGNVVWTETAGTITYTAGAGLMLFSGDNAQAIDFGGQTPEGFAISKTAGGLSFESGTFVMSQNSVSHDVTVSGDADVDLSDSGLTLTLADGADFLADGTGTLRWGNGTIVLNNGDFDNSTQTTQLLGTGTLVMGGTGALTLGVANFAKNLTIAAGGAITVDASSQMVAALTVNGTLSIGAGLKLTSTTAVGLTLGANGTVTGAGELALIPADAGEGILALPSTATIDIAALTIQLPHVDSVFAVGTYESAVTKFKVMAAAAYTVTLSETPSDPYVFAGDLELECTNAGGSLTIANDTNNPDITLQSDLTWTATAGTITYTAGTGTLLFSGDNPQTIDFSGQTADPFAINKADGLLTLASGTFVMGANSTCFDLTVTGDADVDLSDDTLTLTLADGADFFGDSSGTFDCGDAAISMTNGDFDHLDITWSRGTSSWSFAGTGSITADFLLAFYDVAIEAGATITVATATDTYMVVAHELDVAGDLVLDKGVVANLDCDVLLRSTSDTSGGAQPIILYQSTENHGLTTLESGAVVGKISIFSGHLDKVLAAGYYNSDVEVYTDNGADTPLRLDGTYTFADDLIINNTDTGTITIDNAENNPDITLQQSVLTTNSGGGTVTWTKGTGTITATGSANQLWNFAGASVESIVINKPSGYVDLVDDVTTVDFTQTAGIVYLNNTKTLTVTGDAAFDDDLICLSGTGILAVTGTNVARNATITGINSTGTELDATEYCVDGGGNTNVDFGVVEASDTAHLSPLGQPL